VRLKRARVGVCTPPSMLASPRPSSVSRGRFSACRTRSKRTRGPPYLSTSGGVNWRRPRRVKGQRGPAAPPPQLLEVSEGVAVARVDALDADVGPRDHVPPLLAVPPHQRHRATQLHERGEPACVQGLQRGAKGEGSSRGNALRLQEGRRTGARRRARSQGRRVAGSQGRRAGSQGAGQARRCAGAHTAVAGAGQRVGSPAPRGGGGEAGAQGRQEHTTGSTPEVGVRVRAVARSVA